MPKWLFWVLFIVILIAVSVSLTLLTVALGGPQWVAMLLSGVWGFIAGIVGRNIYENVYY